MKCNDPSIPHWLLLCAYGNRLETMVDAVVAWIQSGIMLFKGVEIKIKCPCWRYMILARMYTCTLLKYLAAYTHIRYGPFPSTHLKRVSAICTNFL